MALNLQLQQLLLPVLLLPAPVKNLSLLFKRSST